MFLKVCNVDIFFKSSSREFQSLMEEGIHDFCEILKGVKKVCSAIKLYSHYFSYNVSNYINVTGLLLSRLT